MSAKKLICVSWFTWGILIYLFGFCWKTLMKVKTLDVLCECHAWEDKSSLWALAALWWHHLASGRAKCLHHQPKAHEAVATSSRWLAAWLQCCVPMRVISIKPAWELCRLEPIFPLPWYWPQVRHMRQQVLPEARNSGCISFQRILFEQIRVLWNCHQQINTTCPGFTSSDATNGKVIWASRTRVHETICKTSYHSLPSTISSRSCKGWFFVHAS